MKETHLDLNVWHDGDDWRMTLYMAVDGFLVSDKWVKIKATKERVERYLQISEDHDWWTDNTTDDFYYILFGIKPIERKIDISEYEEEEDKTGLSHNHEYIKIYIGNAFTAQYQCRFCDEVAL